MPSNVEKVFLRAAAERRAVKPSRQEQLRHTSLEAEDFINQYRDEAGNTAAVIGSQFDGGYGVLVTSDPVPPVSSPANVVAGPESLAVQVPGTFVDNAGVTDLSIVAPTYFSRYEIHVSADPLFTALFAETLMGTMDSARGGWYVVSPLPADVPQYVRIVVRSLSGKASEPSAAVEVSPRPKLQPGDLDGKHITGTTFTTRNSRGLWSDDGLFIFREDGTVRIALPTGDAPPMVDAELIARSLTVLGAMSVRGDDNEVASGGGFTLAAGVSAPSSPPNVSMTYPTIKLPAPPEARSSVHGIAYSGGLWWRSVNVWDSDADRLEGFNDAGELVDTVHIAGGGPLYGLTAIDGVLYVMYGNSSNGQIKVSGYDPALPYSISGWVFTGNTGAGTPAIGTDGTNVVIAQCWPSGDVSWWTHNGPTGAVLADQWSSYQLDSDLVGVHIGLADHGAERVTITKANGTTEIFEPDGTQIPWGGWYSRNREEHVGMCWDGSNFRGLAASGRIVEYSNIDGLGGDTNDWWLFNTWIDELGRETTIGPAAQFTLVRRATLTIGRTDVPAGAVTAGLYLARKSSTPTLLEIHQIAQSPMAVRLADIGGWEAGANPPAVNEIPDSLPGWIASQRGLFHAYGDGSGAWGPFGFNPDRTATIRYADVLVNEPFTGITFANGWANYPGYNALVTEMVAPGRVLLAGMLQPGTAAADVRIGAVTDTDHMPVVKQFVPATINNGGSESFSPGVITVAPNGDLRLRGFPSTSNNGYVVVNAEYKV